jgi:hypothetical protein
MPAEDCTLLPAIAALAEAASDLCTVFPRRGRATASAAIRTLSFLTFCGFLDGLVVKLSSRMRPIDEPFCVVRVSR